MFSNFLFGNVDESGKLDRDGLDADLLQTLDSHNEYLSNALSVEGALELETGTFQSKSSFFSLGIISHNSDAIDFSTIEESVPDDQPTKTIIRLKPKQQLISSTIPKSFISLKKQPILSNEEIIKQFFPDLIPNEKLRFAEIFTPKLVLKKSIKSKNVAHKDKHYTLEPDTRDRFYSQSMEIDIYENQVNNLNDSTLDNNNNNLLNSVDSVERIDPVENIPESDFHPINIFSWEDKIIWEDQDEELTQELEPANLSTSNTFIRNAHLDSFEWTDAIIWDDSTLFDFNNIPSPFDPTIIPLVFTNKEQLKDDPKLSITQSNSTKILNRYNISDDHYYESQSSKTAPTRQKHGPIRLQHSLPAIKLMFPYFKFHLTINELRSFHRPIFNPFPNIPITFNRIKNSKIKKKDIKEKDAADLMRSVKDISLRDSSKFVLFEYSEEIPLVMSNPGMASLIYNYYRKIDESDTYMPNLTHGSPYILDAVDGSPFYGFGDVGRGQTIPTLFNNLFRAPLFKHQPNENDFLVIRYRHKGHIKHYIREISHLYCVGQQFPAMEVPRPQSRRNNGVLKARLQVASFRLIRQDPLHRLKLESLFKLFPDFSEAQIRQKVKEFAVFTHKGSGGSWWRLKSGQSLPTEEELRKLLGSEMACLYDAMLVGEQRLRDAGYVNLDGDEEDESIDLEVQLAPWTLSKNFVLAGQGKYMLQLHGPGDPTRIGQGFSFMRTSMKEVFLRAGEKLEDRVASMDTRARYSKFSITEQQMVYREEIDRIWNNQLTGLSGTETPWDDEFNLDDLNETNKSNNKPSTTSSPESIIKHASQLIDDDDDASISRVGGKVLVINRLVENEEGRLVWKTEPVTNPKVMNAYLKQRALIESQVNDADSEEMDEDDTKQLRTQQQLNRYIKQQKDKRAAQEPNQSEKIKIANTNISLTLKLPAQMKSQSKPTNSKSNQEPSTKKRKKEKKKRKPENELCALFHGVISWIISLSESQPFRKPVDPLLKGYYDIVKNPKALEDIQNKAKNIEYTCLDDFVNDIKQVWLNCELYNGVSHPLTAIIKNIVNIAIDKISKDFSLIKSLELEIKENKIHSD